MVLRKMNGKTKALALGILCSLGLTSSTAVAEERGLLSQALLSDEFVAETGIDFHGLVSGGFTWNTSSNDDSFNGPVTFNDRAEEGQMDQLYFVIERTAESGTWDIGGRVDLMYGTDAGFTTSAGFDDNFTRDSSSQYYKFAMPQVYVELQTPIGEGLSVKAGHFYSLIGYEVVPANGNFFYSRSYSKQYAEPFTHWGAIASYPVSDTISFSGGAVMGWNNLEDRSDSNLSVLGSVTITPCDRASLEFSLITGNEGNNMMQTMYSLVASYDVTDAFTYVFQHDLGYNEGDGMGAETQWYSFNNYFLYTIDEMISLGARLEWFRDDDGVRVVGPRSGSGGVPADYYALTLGANVQVTDYLVFRPEYRVDYQDTRKGATTEAFEGGADDLQMLVAGNLILTF